jgi:hypothetical protein
MNPLRDRDLGDECDAECCRPGTFVGRCGCETNEAFLGPDGVCVVCGYDW